MENTEALLFLHPACFIAPFPRSLTFLGNQPGQIFTAQRSECVCVGVFVCMCVSLCLFEKDWKAEIETEIGKDSSYNAAEMQMLCFLDGFEVSLVIGAGKS